MVNESLALHRIGEWADLSDESLHIYLDLAIGVHSEKLDEVDDFDGLEGEAYFKFLNENVLSDPIVVDQLEQLGVEQSKLNDFRQGSVPIKDNLPDTVQAGLRPGPSRRLRHDAEVLPRLHRNHRER